MIFVTSGSMLPFDRLFRLIDDAVETGVIRDEVFAQIGEGKYEPKRFPFERFVEKERFDLLVSDASLVIAHAGIGVIMQALEAGTPLLVLTRKAALGEHVNDHQVSTAKKFESLGHILTLDGHDLEAKLNQIGRFVPRPRSPNVAGVGLRISQFLNELIIHDQK